MIHGNTIHCDQSDCKSRTELSAKDDVQDIPSAAEWRGWTILDVDGTQKHFCLNHGNEKSSEATKPELG
jgi:hypothetical protein